MQKSLRSKIIALVLVSGVLPVLVLFLIVSRQYATMEGIVESEVNHLLKETQRSQLTGVLSMAASLYDRAEKSLGFRLDLVYGELDELGGLTVGKEGISMRFIDPGTQSIYERVFPRLLIGQDTIGSSESPHLADFANTIARQIQAEFRVYAVAEGTDELVCITSSDVDVLGGGLIGSRLSRNSGSLAAQQIFDAFQLGDNFVGLDPARPEKPVVALFHPIYGKDRSLVGALCIAMPKTILNFFEEHFGDFHVGQNGFIWIARIDPAHEERGFRMIFSSSDYGVDHWFTGPAKGAFLQILHNAQSLRKGKIAVQEVSVDGGGSEGLDDIRVDYTYLPSWNWVLGVTVFESDFDASRAQIQDLFTDTIVGTLLGVGIILTLVIVVAVYYTGQVIHPVRRLIMIAQRVASGNIGEAMLLLKRFGESEKRTLQETQQLYEAMGLMVRNLDSLLGRIKQITNTLMRCTADVREGSQIRERSIAELKESSVKIANALEGVSDASEDLSKTMSNVAQVANETGSMAGSGKEELSNIEETMQNISLSNRSIASKLSAITEKASNIGSVVTTISKVADQTNLLSLNAAIEAEKAGEFGVGFAVVAREIRRLADQAAMATSDIGLMVKEMQSAVTAGSMEMEQFTGDVGTGVEEMSRISGHFEKIIHDVEELTPRFDAVKAKMQSQAKGAYEINQEMGKLSSSVHEATKSVKRFEESTDTLMEIVDKLRSELSGFVTMSGGKED